MLTQEEFTKAVNHLEALEKDDYYFVSNPIPVLTKVLQSNNSEDFPPKEVAHIGSKQYEVTIDAGITSELFDLIVEYAETPVDYRKQVKHYAYIIKPHDPEDNRVPVLLNRVPVLIKKANGQWIIDKGYLYESSDGRWIETKEDSDKVGFTDKEITESPLYLSDSMFTKLEVSVNEK
jgi:hypothetical protein